MDQPSQSTTNSQGWWSHAGTLTQVAVYLIIATTSWYMLKELAVLLRPLLLATLICYLVLPMHSRLQRKHSEPKVIVMMLAGGLLFTTALGLILYGSVISMNEQMPRLTERAQELANNSQNWSRTNFPNWMNLAIADFFRVESQGVQMLQHFGSVALQYTADILIETAVVALYVMFLLFEARRLTKRVQLNFESEKSGHILETVRRINDGIANYLKAKVKTSLILAIPVTVILFAFGVKFPAIWGLLTFAVNFIPYVGTAIGLCTPAVFCFLDLPLGWEPFTVVLLLCCCHAASAAFVEPMLIGNAVGLSPLVVLISLTLWGLCWGLVGMFLAIPLTVTLKIVLANIETTKPIAALLGDDQVTIS